MNDLKFKDIINQHLGCSMLDEEGLTWKLKTVKLGLNGNTIFEVTRRSELGGTWSIRDFEYRTGAKEIYKPILFPLSAMTGEHKMEIMKFYTTGKEESHFASYENMARVTAYLLRNHFNVFNLPESEYIDASKLPVNPYSKH